MRPIQKGAPPNHIVLVSWRHIAEFIEHYDKIIAALSGVAVAAFTGTLWWSTRKLWKAGLTQFDAAQNNAERQSKDMQEHISVSRMGAFATVNAAHAAQKSADAADRSARAAIALQLPIIRIVPDKLGHGDGIVDDKPYEDCSVHSVMLSNLGPAKAFPKEIAYGWALGNELPPNQAIGTSIVSCQILFLNPIPRSPRAKFSKV